MSDQGAAIVQSGNQIFRPPVETFDPSPGELFGEFLRKGKTADPVA